MNKRELIERINNTLFDNLKDTLFTEPTLSITESAKNNKVALMFETEQGGVLLGGMLKKFEKVTIPQFVADWYEKHKYNFEFNMWDYVYRFDTQEDTSFKEWLNDSKTEPFKTLVNMHQFGYEVEKEKRYRVSLKNGQPLLKAYLGKALYFSQDIAIERCKVTRKQLEEAGFGAVFNSPLFEVKEVEE